MSVLAASPTPNCRASYNQSLRHSLGSKLFFLDKVPLHEIGMVVDYGCADGALLKAISHVLPNETLLIGIDHDVAQCQAARCHFAEGDGFYTGWAEVDGYLAEKGDSAAGKSLLILSSVLHEVFTGMSNREQIDFVDMIRGKGFDFIAVRDMALPAEIWRQPTPWHWESMVLSTVSTKRIADFEQHHGTIGYLHNFIHLLLKLPHEHDWKKEVVEDYLPYSAGSFTALFAHRGDYVLRHKDFTATKFFRSFVKREFGFDVAGLTTHVELVLQRRG